MIDRQCNGQIVDPIMFVDLALRQVLTSLVGQSHSILLTIKPKKIKVNMEDSMFVNSGVILFCGYDILLASCSGGVLVNSPTTRKTKLYSKNT